MPPIDHPQMFWDEANLNDAVSPPVVAFLWARILLPETILLNYRQSVMIRNMAVSRVAQESHQKQARAPSLFLFPST